MASYVHRVKQTEGDDYVLLNVINTGSKGVLDLDIEGTEGENPYFASYKHARIHESLHKNSQITPDEWEFVVRSLLLYTRPSTPEQQKLLKNLELSAYIGEDQSVTLRFRRNIEGIAQRIGELVLSIDDSRELNTLEWIGTAATRANGLESEYRALQSEHEKQEVELEELRAKLDELVLAKKKHEDELLEKFAMLLNSKKSKIRDQQRLLNVSKVDKEKAEAIVNARGNASGSSKNNPRTRKSANARKRKPRALHASPSDDSDEFETMPVPRKPGSARVDRDEGTSDGTDAADETTDIGDDSSGPDDLDAAPEPGPRKSAETTNATSTQAEKAQQDDVPRPPKRDLPFGMISNKRKSPTPDVQPMMVDSDAETESDDEL